MLKLLFFISLMFHNQETILQQYEDDVENHEVTVEELNDESVSVCAQPGPDINIEPDPNTETDTYSFR